MCVCPAEEEFGAALLDYMLAGELESCHFQEEVPTTVWPNQVRGGATPTS